MLPYKVIVTNKQLGSGSGAGEVEFEFLSLADAKAYATALRAGYSQVNIYIWDGTSIIPYADSFTGLLDTYSGAAAAYSLRQLSSTYEGDAIVVRRASDSATQAIGFVNNELDTTSLESFCSGTDGFVTTWYDQSGNGNDAAQASASSQPKIVSSGSTILENGKAAVDFDGSDFLSHTGQVINNRTELTAFSVNYGVRTTGTGSINIEGSIGGADSFIMTTETGVRTGGGFITFGQQSTSVLSLITMHMPSNAAIRDITCFINSLSSAQTALGDNAIDLGQNTLIELGGGASTAGLDGKVSEVVLYTSNQLPNRSGIETNINDFYSIY